MQHHSNPVHPQNIGGIYKKGIGIGEDALIRITAALCANPDIWNKSSKEIIDKARSIHNELINN